MTFYFEGTSIEINRKQRIHNDFGMIAFDCENNKESFPAVIEKRNKDYICITEPLFKNKVDNSAGLVAYLIEISKQEIESMPAETTSLPDDKLIRKFFGGGKSIK